MDAVAQQETDEKTSGFTQGEAALASATAKYRSSSSNPSSIFMRRCRNYHQRNTDIGALI